MSNHPKDKIEQARLELNKLALEFGLQDPRVLLQSMKLDDLINEYNDSGGGQSS